MAAYCLQLIKVTFVSPATLLFIYLINSKFIIWLELHFMKLKRMIFLGWDRWSDKLIRLKALSACIPLALLCLFFSYYHTSPKSNFTWKKKIILKQDNFNCRMGELVHKHYTSLKNRCLSYQNGHITLY